jgi:hypothetical protein
MKLYSLELRAAKKNPSRNCFVATLAQYSPLDVEYFETPLRRRTLFKRSSCTFTGGAECSILLKDLRAPGFFR